MFIDAVTLKLLAGKGGNGVIAWRREKYIPKGGPNGGDGGHGGSIQIRCNDQIVCLQDYRHKRIMNAKNGDGGGGNCRKGKDGKDLIIEVPCGTLAKDAATGEVLFDFTEHGQKWIPCKGGKGGKGNTYFKSAINRAPYKCTPGKPGQNANIQLELKLIADIGLVGMPNAGKSTLMSQISARKVKIGAYPFTTLRPNLSYIQDHNLDRLLIADIPGIIEGAHQNKGLGFEFLRHIERTSTLVYVIDLSGIDNRDPAHDYHVLRNELKEYNPSLLDKPSFVVLNKLDTEWAQENLADFRASFEGDPATLMEMSALEGTGINALKEALFSPHTTCVASC